MTERSDAQVAQADRVAALRRSSRRPAQSAKILTAGLGTTVMLGIVTYMGYSANAAALAKQATVVPAPVAPAVSDPALATPAPAIPATTTAPVPGGTQLSVSIGLATSTIAPQVPVAGQTPVAAAPSAAPTSQKAPAPTPATAAPAAPSAPAPASPAAQPAAPPASSPPQVIAVPVPVAAPAPAPAPAPPVASTSPSAPRSLHPTNIRLR